MPERRRPPPTEEGWYALHDFRTIDWDAWQRVPQRDRERTLGQGVSHLQTLVDVEDADEGATACYTVLGHEADLLFVHLRPSTAHLDAIERRFARTDLARYTFRTNSYVSVTEASGYSERAREYFEGDLDEDSGLARYIRSRLYPTIPDAEHVCFYPMDKRREPGQNWYDLPFDERAEHMQSHGEIGRDYGGRVTQMITGSVGLDDHEWGVTLWADDLTDVKDLLYEMRFDPSTSQFADFGSFFVGRRFQPGDLPAVLSGEAVPSDDPGAADDRRSAPQGTAGGRAGGADSDDTDGDPAGAAGADAAGADATGAADGTTDGTASDRAASNGAGADGDTGGEPAGEGSGSGGPPAGDVDLPGESDPEDLAGRLGSLGLHAGEDYAADDYGVVCYSGADAQDLAAEVADLRDQFDHYDTHVRTVVRAQGGRSAVVSIWETARAAETAAGFLGDLSGVGEFVRGPLAEGETGETTAVGGGDSGAGAGDRESSIREELADLDVYAGQPHGEDVYALVCYSRADRADLVAAVEDLADGFDRYDTHEETAVYAETGGDTAAVVSLWETADAADTAGGYLADLPGIVGWADDREGFGTMGMFYTVEPAHREEFVATFEAVGDLLADMEGHRETALLENVEDENDMFIASQWDAREDAMEFFRSEAFGETVQWGRDVLADRPRHVFLA